jgi:hypothetical protein
VLKDEVSNSSGKFTIKEGLESRNATNDGLESGNSPVGGEMNKSSLESSPSSKELSLSQCLDQCRNISFSNNDEEKDTVTVYNEVSNSGNLTIEEGLESGSTNEGSESWNSPFTEIPDSTEAGTTNGSSTSTVSNFNVSY